MQPPTCMGAMIVNLSVSDLRWLAGWLGGTRLRKSGGWLDGWVALGYVSQVAGLMAGWH